MNLSELNVTLEISTISSERGQSFGKISSYETSHSTSTQSQCLIVGLDGNQVNSSPIFVEPMYFWIGQDHCMYLGTCIISIGLIMLIAFQYFDRFESR
jgi:hypothetical protein